MPSYQIISQMAKGKVDFFNDKGGYGFIDTDDTEDDVFFHMEDVSERDIEEGQEVEFDITQSSEGGIRAANVVSAGSLPEQGADDAFVEETTSEITSFLQTHAPDDAETVHINVTDSELEGEFERMSDELDMPEDEVSMLRNLISELIETRLENEKMTMSNEMKEATANVIASTLIQEYNQTGGES